MPAKPEQDLAGGMAGAIFMVAIVMAIIAIWLVAKAMELVIRVMVAHPDNKVMWAALGFFVVSCLAVLVTAARYSWVNAIALAAFGLLVLAAKAVELYYDQLLQREWSRDSLVHEVLHEPWWNAA